MLRGGVVVCVGLMVALHKQIGRGWGRGGGGGTPWCFSFFDVGSLLVSVGYFPSLHCLELSVSVYTYCTAYREYLPTERLTKPMFLFSYLSHSCFHHKQAMYTFRWVL